MKQREKEEQLGNYDNFSFFISYTNKLNTASSKEDVEISYLFFPFALKCDVAMLGCETCAEKD